MAYCRNSNEDYSCQDQCPWCREAQAQGKPLLGATGELKPGEIFLANYCDNEGDFPPKYLEPLKTIRLGFQAYDITGTEELDREYRPLIIHKSEYDQYNRIMQNRLKERNEL